MRRPPTAVLLALLASLSIFAVLAPPTSAQAQTPRSTTQNVQITQAAAPSAKAESARITGWRAAPAAVKARSSYVVRVTVAGGSRPVRLQRQAGDRWRNVAGVRSTSTGRATLRWKTPRTARKVALRVYVPRDGARPSVSTPVRVVRVRPHGLGISNDPLSPLLRRVVTLVNQVRATGTTCGGQKYGSRPPLRVNLRLNRAAGKYARTLADQDFFAHESRSGSDAGNRIDAEGYRWRSWGENLAAGYTKAADAVDGWLESDGHCRNLMGDWREIGLGYAYNADSTYGSYWVQNFATR